jgi:hypothetical protein
VEFPATAWPKQRGGEDRLTEVEVTHWPTSFRPLIAAGDQRLPQVRIAA